MQYWLNLGFVPLEQLVPLAVAAERLGLEGIALPDHLFFPATIDSPYPYSRDGSIIWPEATPWPDPWVAIAAMAQATERIHFSTGVFVAPLRDPFALAKAVSTAAVLSGGRLSCGFGTGRLREEFDIVGIEFATRGARLEEMLQVMQLLWTGEMVEHAGRFFTLPRIQMCPPAGPVPILIGGNSAVAMRRAVRYDGWIGAHTNVETTRDRFEQLGALLARDGRDPQRFATVVTGPRAARDATALDEIGIGAITIAVAALTPSTRLEDRIDALETLAEARSRR